MNETSGWGSNSTFARTAYPLMITVYLKRIVQTKLIYSTSLGYRNRMLPATGFYHRKNISRINNTGKENYKIRLIPFSLLSDVNAECLIYDHTYFLLQYPFGPCQNGGNLRDKNMECNKQHDKRKKRAAITLGVLTVSE